MGLNEALAKESADDRNYQRRWVRRGGYADYYHYSTPASDDDRVVTTIDTTRVYFGQWQTTPLSLNPSLAWLFGVKSQRASQNRFETNDPGTIDNQGSGQDCNISVSFTGDSVNLMKNGVNYYHGNPGLGFTVSISGLGAGGIATLGENKVDPKGHWILQQLMNVYAWNSRQGDTTAPTAGYVSTFSDRVDPASIIRNDNRSGGWIDHPGPNMRNESGKLLTASYSKWNFLIKAYNGKKECRVGFPAEMSFNNGIFRAHWGPGLY